MSDLAVVLVVLTVVVAGVIGPALLLWVLTAPQRIAARVIVMDAEEEWVPDNEQ